MQYCVLKFTQPTGVVWKNWHHICVWFPSPGYWAGWRLTKPKRDISIATQHRDSEQQGNFQFKDGYSLCWKRGEAAGNVSTLMQMPQPMHRDSEMKTILLCGVTSIHSLPANISWYVILRLFLWCCFCVNVSLKSYPYGPLDSSFCIPDDISWVCICHGWQWRSWCFYLPLWAEKTAASTLGAKSI